MSKENEDYLVRRIEVEPFQHRLPRPATLAALTQFPRYFEIETINACQASCPMCTISDWSRRDGVMRDDLFIKIANEIHLHPEVRRVHLYRDGEPLLDKKIAKRVAIMKNAGVPEVGISTNVELLDEERGLDLLQAGLDEIILSIDSVFEDTYNKIRVGLDFKTVRRNAHLFFKLRDGLRSKCKIRVRMIRQPLNEHEWYHGRFQVEWRDDLRLGDTTEYRDIHNWGGQLAGDFAGAVSKPCLALWSLFTIFADGTVPLCNVDYNAKYRLGSVRDSSIAALWQSVEQERRRALHMNGEREKISLCTKCTVWSERETLGAA